MSECLSIKFVYYTLMTEALNRFFNVVSVFWTQLYIAMLMQHFKSYEIHTDHMKKKMKRKGLMICKTQKVSHRWGYRRISRLRQPVQTELIPTGRTPSPLRGISLSLCLSLYHSDSLFLHAVLT